MTLSLPRIAILGTGHMGGAILGGLIQTQDAFESIRVTCATAASARALAERGVEVRSLEDDAGANQWALDEADIIILGVKPHYLLGLLREVAPHAPESAVMVSIAAGITVEHMEQLWAGALIRTMPNTPSQVGKGVTGLSVGSRVTEDQLQAVTRVFETVGSVLQVDESSLNALSTFSGSGPAFVYFFIERFMEVAHEHGFTPEQATTMVQGTFAGAMELLEHSGKTPQELREAVTSPGGTTQAALEVYRAADLSAIIREASAAAIARAEEMAKG
ncbi:MAG: pyrroline-5-carboxylate reductase [Pontimonas sp.]|nr:pyrroline-5-carboxylate reductase [Pontimonas sp.]